MTSSEVFQGGTDILEKKEDVTTSTDNTPAETEGVYKKYCRWTPTSKQELNQSERKILSYIKTAHTGRYVDISITIPPKCKWSWSNKSHEDLQIWTLMFNGKASENTPLVLIHGLCAAAGLWALNMDALAASRPVYAIDLLGFGKSSRPNFSTDASEAENQHIEAIEAWRKEMKLERFILLGHSMGGFLSTAYSLKYPNRVTSLVLADPWGFSKKPENPAEHFKVKRPRTMKVIAFIMQRVNPLSLVRIAGPYGPGWLPRARPDLLTKFEALDQNGKASVAEYLYHSNVQSPTGEGAFRSMMDYFAWAKNPMHNRIHDLNSEVPLTMIYGGTTWLPHIREEELKVLRPNGSVDVHTIPDAGHHVYADNQLLFNEIVRKVGVLADQQQEQKSL